MLQIGLEQREAVHYASCKGDRGSALVAVMKIRMLVMQAIGQGPASTHYGNNERRSHGFYGVTAPVKGVTARCHSEE
jgi:hypothetical protein